MTGELHLACTASAVFVRAHQVTEMLNDYREITAALVSNPQFEEHQQRITAWTVKWETFLRDQAVDTDCGWEGDVTGVWAGGHEFVWICPGCGQQNATMLEADDDRGLVAP